jgi:hypothetical protein
MSDVREHTRNGRRVRSYSRTDDGGDWEPDSHAQGNDNGEAGPGDVDPEVEKAQKKRERLQKRVERERTGRRTPAEKRDKRAPGEKKKRKKSSGQKSKQHLGKARRTSKKHPWKRAGHSAAAGIFGAAAVGKWAGRKLKGEWS